mmetsp:Transcript_18016/g.50005  ORF Transcript_18016/g.50005 Transcript_18016/m.50005 type:complete len:298 (-) Transcript_18016:3180-4073(-)
MDDTNDLHLEAHVGTNGSSFEANWMEFVAKALGYMVGIMSLLLYTPIAVRICLQKHANGLVMSTWWLKLTSYLLSDTYYVRQKYDVSTYAEILIITIESAVVLVLVIFYQNRTREALVWMLAGALALGMAYLATIAPEHLVAIGQLSSVAINTAALVPQCVHNTTTRSKGDYSPLTASLATLGCAVRLFTTVTLNGSDPVLLVTFLVAFSANLSLLLQILYFGIRVEGLTLKAVYMADVGGVSASAYDTIGCDDNDDDDDDENVGWNEEFETVTDPQNALRDITVLELPDTKRSNGD